MPHLRILVSPLETLISSSRMTLILIDHPKRFSETTQLSALAYNLIPESAMIRRIYELDGLLEFIAAVQGIEKLYCTLTILEH